MRQPLLEAANDNKKKDATLGRSVAAQQPSECLLGFSGVGSTQTEKSGQCALAGLGSVMAISQIRLDRETLLLGSCREMAMEFVTAKGDGLP